MGWIIAAILGYLLWKEKNETTMWKNMYYHEWAQTEAMRKKLHDNYVQQQLLAAEDGEQYDRNS